MAKNQTSEAAINPDSHDALVEPVILELDGFTLTFADGRLALNVTPRWKEHGDRYGSAEHSKSKGDDPLNPRPLHYTSAALDRDAFVRHV